MAIDSKAKRQSACFFRRAGAPRTAFPDGSIDQADRQDTAGFYRGILAGAAELLTTLMLVNFFIDNIEQDVAIDNIEQDVAIDNIERGLR